MKHFLIILCTLACSLGVNAQNQNAQGLNMQNQQVQDQKVLTGTLWDNWFVQAGLDMSLQNPYDAISRRCSQKERPSVWMWRWENGLHRMWLCEER